VSKTGWVRVVGGAYDGEIVALSTLAKAYGCSRAMVRRFVKDSTFYHSRMTAKKGRKRKVYQVIGGDIDGEKMTAHEIAAHMDVHVSWVYHKVNKDCFVYRDVDREQQRRGLQSGVRMGSTNPATAKVNLNPAALAFGSLKWGGVNAHG